MGTVKQVCLAVGVLAALVIVPTSPAVAAPTGPVTAPPASWTPSLVLDGDDTHVEQIRQLVQCGGVMFAVGSFSQIKQGAVTYNRNNVFAFSATTGAVSGWNPNITGPTGTVVNSIAVSANCATVYIGGIFDKVGAAAVNDIASVSVATGALNTGFRHSTDGQVSAMLVSGNHVLVGGYFTNINQSPRDYFASLNPSTGVDDGYVNLNISGHYTYNDQAGNPAAANTTRIYNFSLNPLGNRLLVMGDFTLVGGVARRQIFMLSLNATNTTVHPWYSAEFDKNCAISEPFWLQDASWAPDGSKIYIAATGYKPALNPGFTTTNPRVELCDSAAAFPTTAGMVTHSWVNYTGCDSLYSTAADASTVYIGGHERWATSPNGCDGAGTQGTPAPGMAGLNPTSGALSFNPTRGRGLGADDMLVTAAGLWIASDNFQDTDDCAGVTGHSGICFLPYPARKAKVRADYNADGVADFAQWTPATGVWTINNVATPAYGKTGDVPLAGDFTGTAASDLAVYRPSTGQWFIKGVTAPVSYGNSTDKPVAADYNGDGKADIAVWRPSNGTWNVHGISGAFAFGVSGDIPVPGDYNGDGKADFAVYRPSTGTWYVRGMSSVVWGQAGDKPVVADFTGDAKDDIAIWRPNNATWYVRGVATTQWGTNGDVPVAGDFTGDGRADLATWVPSTHTWHVYPATDTTQGVAGDVPLFG